MWVLSCSINKTKLVLVLINSVLCFSCKPLFALKRIWKLWNLHFFGIPFLFMYSFTNKQRMSYVRACVCWFLKSAMNQQTLMIIDVPVVTTLSFIQQCIDDYITELTLFWRCVTWARLEHLAIQAKRRWTAVL